jgi:geranylgeranyl pyrophosphate synthase
MEAEDFGNSIGIIGGNTTFFLGLQSYLYNEFEHDLNLKAIKLYQEAFIEVGDGVIIEIDMVNRRQLPIKEYVNMISLKTGALIAKSILIGAVYAKAEEKYLPMLSKLGFNIGIIFQIIDDILGTFGNEEITGKPTDGDIREGKKTCLLITALNGLSKNKQNKLLDLTENPNMSNEDVNEVKDLFLEADVVEKCKNLAKKYYDETIEIINELKPAMNPSEIEFFESLLSYLLERTF